MARAPITRANPYYSHKYGRWFQTEREYRNFLARRKGFGSWYEEQRAPRPIRGEVDIARLRPAERDAVRRAFEALSLMRRERLSLAEAADRAGTTPNAVIRHVGPALERSAGGRYRARPRDRLTRPIEVLTVDGPQVVIVRGSGAASLIGSYEAAVGHYLQTGDASRLARFEGKRVAGITLEADPDAIDEWARRGELQIEDIYALAA
jgi:hypothetical protein